MSVKDNKTVIRAWSMYDWANSVYALVITSTIFPIYYNNVTSLGDTDIVHFLGIDFTNTALYAYALATSFLLIAFLFPFLSAMADYSGRKKEFMQFFCYLGGLACMGLYLFTGPETLGWGLTCFILATVGYAGSIIFYNAYLPEIASPENQDRVSAQGFSMGYVGSVILLLFNLSMLMKPEWYGIQSDTLPARISFLTVGIWWVGFAQIPFYYLPRNVYQRKVKENIWLKGYRELVKVFRKLLNLPFLLIFLGSFFFYIMAVQTVMYEAAPYGEKELELESSTLIMTVLIIQLVAIGGASLFSRISGGEGHRKGPLISLSTWAGICIASYFLLGLKGAMIVAFWLGIVLLGIYLLTYFFRTWDNLNVLLLIILIWIGVMIGAYFIEGAVGFVAVSSIVGFVMGGIQAMSRSTYSKLLPDTYDHSAFFSFYAFVEKIGIVLGMFSFGWMEEMTGTMRNSLFLLVAFFLIGFALLIICRKKAMSLE